MKSILVLFFSFSALAQQFPISGKLHSLTSVEVPSVDSQSGLIQINTLTYIKTKSGEGAYICPFLSDRSFQTILSIASTAMTTSKEVFMSTVRTDYQGRALTASRYGKEMENCVNSISLYQVGLDYQSIGK